ncbi:glycosyl hydrolase [Nocardioides sp. GY 10127]|uniref:glycosyl hydrolase n=1 Tax=Nocardioides sp. GY 10127 TaxID=2569762 RepID=UPI0014589135|nr:glycosyl hydrolase [Nocardioides sp. GY 10127]
MPDPDRRSRRSAAVFSVVGAVLAMGITHLAVVDAGLGSALAVAKGGLSGAVREVVGANDDASAGEAAEPTETVTTTVTSDPSQTASTDAAATDSATATDSSSAAQETCYPDTAPVDSEATAAVGCLLATIDSWRDNGQVGLGQQVNISSAHWARPLNRLGALPAVVGFDAQELVDALGYGSDHTSDLAAIADQGVVLTASWHAPNPWTGGAADDTTGQGKLSQVLDSSTDAGVAFWSDYDAVLDRFQALQDRGVAVLFRPLHESNGDWFWWGAADSSTLVQLYAAMQQRAYDRGIHNIAWAYGQNADNSGTTVDTTNALPASVDLVGVDAYCDLASDGLCLGSDGSETGMLDVTGYSELAATGLRAAFTEVGPRDDYAGAFDPQEVLDTASAQSVLPAYVMFWFDDGAGKKQIASLADGQQWFASCGAVCQVR